MGPNSPGHRPASTYLGHAKLTDTYWYLEGVPELFVLAPKRFERFAAPRRKEVPMTPTFDTLVQDFFCRRLIEQAEKADATMEAYRDAFRLLLAYLLGLLKKRSLNELADLDVPVIRLPGPPPGRPPQWARTATPGWRPYAPCGLRRIVGPDGLAAGQRVWRSRRSAMRRCSAT